MHTRRYALKLALLGTGQPQYAVAAACGLNETRLSRISLGRAEATEAEKLSLSAYLGRTVEDLFGPEALQTMEAHR